MRPSPDPVVYLYCVTRGAKAPSLTRAPGPLPGMSPPRTLSGGEGLWLVVSDAPADQYGEGPLNERLEDVDWVSRCALAHEAVIEHAAKGGTALPLKLFTLFHGEARALSFVKKKRAQLVRALDRIEGCAEYGVRLTLDERRARRAAAREVRADGRAAAGALGGAAFLLRKKQIRDASAQLSRAAAEEANALYEALSEVAKEARRRTEVEGLAPGSRLVMDGVFLVPARQAARFKAKVTSATKALHPRGYDVALNGPWPPYHFV